MELSKLLEFVVTQQNSLAEIILGIIFVARLIAKLTPSKRDDEITSITERRVRKAITLISGANHENLVKSQEELVESAPKETENDDPFDALLALINKLDGKIVIVPKEKKDA